MVTKHRPAVWCIGGSDSGGGAGVQADLLTLYDLGVHGCTIVTAVTAQNSLRVNTVDTVSSETIVDQGQTLLADIAPQAIKIGLLCDDEQVDAVVAVIQQVRRQHASVKVIWDPVQVASTGDALGWISPRGIVSLLSVVDVCTPNHGELAALADAVSVVLTLNSSQHAEQRVLAAMHGHAPALLVTGGNQQAHCASDKLVRADDCWVFSSSYLDVAHTHGTGCTLASAIGASMALGYQIQDAVCIAKAYVNAGLEEGYAAGRGSGPLARTGWPAHEEYFPMASFGDEDNCSHYTGPAFAPLACEQLGIYPVVDSLSWLERLLPLGFAIIQLRIKTPGADLATQIQRAVALASSYKTRLFINDYWQLAIEYGAYGVHLGQEDLATADLTAIAQAGLRLGVSTHGYAEIQRVRRLNPSYIALGHIFATQTKVMPSNPQGLSNLAKYVALLGGIPTVAIGGINQARIQPVANTGVSGIAVVTAISAAGEPLGAARALQEAHPYVD
ncbi:thiamine phosphate synthase [Alteromonas gilva]|uniref:Thiamine-phosphate synthase n=1 Tax=Alteromonas gilva TaxID=2987522 RepID=A0ABT5L4Q9_9ALTE|nr:thiamine phosphate synthase [Alteromonas gilva]MDC8832019.1 thiamine phosphate synthase [Alteromonas gilva]